MAGSLQGDPGPGRREGPAARRIGRPVTAQKNGPLRDADPGAARPDRAFRSVPLKRDTKERGRVSGDHARHASRPGAGALGDGQVARSLAHGWISGRRRRFSKTHYRLDFE